MNEINQNKVNESENTQEYLQSLVKTIENLKDIISALTKNLSDIEKENEALSKENMDLKSKVVNASELLKENEMYKMKVAELEREIKEYKKNQEIFEAEKASLKKTEGDVYVLHKRIDELEIHNRNILEKPASATIASAIKSTPPPTKESKIEEVEILENTTDGRRKCPNCGNPNPASIHELDDKTRIIMNYPRMYGKKFKCGECGIEWK